MTPSGGVSTTFTGAVDGVPAVLPLLGHTVTGEEVPTDGTVRVAFDGGSVVDVLDSQAHYESYQVNLGERLLVV